MIVDIKHRDKGYGWVIVLAFFTLELLIDGIRFSFGLFFVEFLAEFNSDKADTAWVGAMMMGVYNLSGPIFAVIVNKVGYRKASILGSIIATTGFVLSFFATELYHLYFTFGIIQGFGYGLSFLASTVAIGRYFYRRRAFAFGISFCGSGVGLFVMPPLLRLLLETYTWRGTMLIIAGMALNGCVLSALYRPIAEKEEIDVTDYDKPDNDGNGDKKAAVNDVITNKNGRIRNESHNPLLNSESCTAQKGLRKGRKDLNVTRTFDEIRKEEFLNLKENSDHGSRRSLNLSVVSQSIFGSNASFEHMFEKHSIHKMSSLSLQAKGIASVKTVVDQSEKRFKISAIENIFPRALVANVKFKIFMMSTLFIGVTAFVPFSLLPDYAMSNGATPLQGAWLLSAMGIGGTVGRIGAGVLSDLPCVHSLTLLGVCCFVIGSTTVIVALAVLYEIFIIYSMLYGIFFGAIYVVQPVVLLEYFGEQYISEVLGITMSVYGVSGFVGNPVAGWIFDITGSYKVSFLTTGVCFFIGGIINFFVLCTKPSRETRRITNLEVEVITPDKV